MHDGGGDPNYKKRIELYRYQVQLKEYNTSLTFCKTAYDCKVGAAANLSMEQQIEAAQVILRTVKAIGNTIADAMNEADPVGRWEGNAVTSTQAFNEKIRPTTFQVYAPVRYKDSKDSSFDYGIPGHSSWVGNNQGNGTIQVSMAGLDGSSHYGSGAERTRLVAHEIAHHFTWANQDWYSGQSYANPAFGTPGQPEQISSSQYWDQYSTVRAQSSGESYEYSADLIGDWLLGFGGSTQNQLANCMLAISCTNGR